MAMPPKASTTEEENKQNSLENSEQPSTTKSNEPEKSESIITSSVPPKPISSEEAMTSLKTLKKNEQFETTVNTDTDPNKSFGTTTYSTEKPGLVDVPQQPSTTKSTEPEKSEPIFTSSSPPKPISSEEIKKNEQSQTLVNTNTCPRKSRKYSTLLAPFGLAIPCALAANRNSSGARPTDHVIKMNEGTLQTPGALPPKSDLPDERMASNEQLVTDGNINYTSWPKVGEIKPDKKRGGHYPNSSSAKATDHKKSLRTVDALPGRVDSSNSTVILTPIMKSTEQLVTVVDTSDNGKSSCTAILSPQTDDTENYFPSSAIKQTSSSATLGREKKKNEEMVQTVDATMMSTHTTNTEQLVTVDDNSDPTKSSCTTNLSQIGGTIVDLPSAIRKTSCPETTADDDTTVDKLPEKPDSSNATMISTHLTNTEQSLTDWVPQMDRIEIVQPSSATNQNSSSATTAEQEMERTGAHILNVLYGKWKGRRRLPVFEGICAAEKSPEKK